MSAIEFATLSDATAYVVIDDAHTDSTFALLKSEYEAVKFHRDGDEVKVGKPAAITLDDIRSWDKAGRPNPNSLERRQWRHWAAQTGNTDEKGNPTVSYEQWQNEGFPVHPDFIDTVRYAARVILGTDEDTIDVNLTREDLAKDGRGKLTLQDYQAAIAEIDPDYAEYPVVAVITASGKYYPNGKGGLTKTAESAEVRNARREAEKARRELAALQEKNARMEAFMKKMAEKTGMSAEDIAALMG